MAAVVTLSLPGSIQNSLLGMENVVFAACVLTWMYGLRLLETGRVTSHLFAILFGLALGFGAVLRPESVIVVPAVAIGIWVAAERQLEAPFSKILAGAAAATVAGLSVLILFYLETGRLIPNSGISRMMVARRSWASLNLGGVWIYGATFLRVAAYAPIAIAAVLGIYSWNRKQDMGVTVPAIGFSALAGLGLYTFVTGAHHTGRYLIWIFPLLTILAAIGVQHELVDRKFPQKWTVLAFGLAWLVTMLGVETWVRIRYVTGGKSIATIQDRYETRTSRTNRLLETICSGNCCRSSERPELARVEVHNIFYFDRRVEMAAVDGVVAGPGGTPLEYDKNGCSNAGKRIKQTKEVVAVPATPGIERYYKECKNPFLGKVVESQKQEASQVSGWQWKEAEQMLVRTCSAEKESSK
jgi:hypothetical protein